MRNDDLTYTVIQTVIHDYKIVSNHGTFKHEELMVTVTFNWSLAVPDYEQKSSYSLRYDYDVDLDDWAQKRQLKMIAVHICSLSGINDATIDLLQISPDD